MAHLMIFHDMVIRNHCCMVTKILLDNKLSVLISMLVYCISSCHCSYILITPNTFNFHILLVTSSLELPLPDLRGHIFLSLSASPSSGPEAPEPFDWQQGSYQTGWLWTGSGLWCSGQGLYPWGETLFQFTLPWE